MHASTVPSRNYTFTCIGVLKNDANVVGIRARIAVESIVHSNCKASKRNKNIEKIYTPASNTLGEKSQAKAL